MAKKFSVLAKPAKMELMGEKKRSISNLESALWFLYNSYEIIIAIFMHKRVLHSDYSVIQRNGIIFVLQFVRLLWLLLLSFANLKICRFLKTDWKSGLRQRTRNSNRRGKKECAIYMTRCCYTIGVCDFSLCTRGKKRNIEKNGSNGIRKAG